MEKVDGHREIVNAIIEFGNAAGDSSGGMAVGTPEYRARQEELLRMVDEDIRNGSTGMRVCKALLESCRDWSTCVITYPERFRKLLLEAVEHGALAPDCVVGWDWMDVAVRNNDPAEFMDDMLRFYDLLADAGEHGISGAFDIMDMLWEPENCREED
ncbi:MAG: hypothetical protein ACI30N_05910 [Muribaculaceae bacterium]